MGRSEWGICVNSSDDIKAFLAMLTAHDAQPCESKLRGEDLDFGLIVRYNGYLFACCRNLGGGECTSEFIRRYCHSFPRIYFPFAKPDDWLTNFSCVWTHDYEQPLSDQITKLFDCCFPEPVALRTRSKNRH